MPRPKSAQNESTGTCSKLIHAAINYFQYWWPQSVAKSDTELRRLKRLFKAGMGL